ncbi:unnamed protein product, partial [marine sediment metagenome]
TLYLYCDEETKIYEVFGEHDYMLKYVSEQWKKTVFRGPSWDVKWYGGIDRLFHPSYMVDGKTFPNYEDNKSYKDGACDRFLLPPEEYRTDSNQHCCVACTYSSERHQAGRERE